MHRPYSRRHQPTPDFLRYDLPQEVRLRIVHTLEDEVFRAFRTADAFERFALEIENLLCRKYGRLYGPSYEVVRTSKWPGLEHFFSCPDELAFDYIEFSFEVAPGATAPTVDAINDILREEGIGYELTQMVEHPKRKSEQEPTYTFPIIIRRTDQYTHESIIKPCLTVLAQPAFQTANEEMLRAHEAYRQGNYRNAMTECGAALETVFKIICSAKGWTYDPQKATLKDLVETCRANGLFFEFYTELFKNAGTVRNKLGAHGQGPVPQFVAGPEHVEHLLQMTAAHIVFLAKLADI